MEELESSRQSRLRAWEALQKFRSTLSDLIIIMVPFSTAFLMSFLV
jgi:hypothetical protein